jgi:hypothetical protein
MKFERFHPGKRCFFARFCRILAKRTQVFICLVVLVSGNILNSQGLSLVDLNELENPGYLVASKDFFVIEDNQNVKLYSMKGFNLIKTIGRRGEGPGEFKSFAFPQILPDSIMISSPNKVSFFNFSGELLTEKKTKLSRYRIRKIGNKYIGDAVQRGKDDFYLAYIIYDSEFSKIKEFYKGKWVRHKDGRRDLFEIYFFDVYDNKIIFAHRTGFNIEILNDKGDNLHKIKLNPPRIPFNDKDMDNILKDMMINTKEKNFVQYIKTKSIKPDYFPDIRKCLVANDKIYVLTYLKKNRQTECYIFNMKGQQLKRIFIPLRDTSPIVMPPFTITNGHLYQLIENEKKEQWQLVVDKIE